MLKIFLPGEYKAKSKLKSWKLKRRINFRGFRANSRGKSKKVFLSRKKFFFSRTARDIALLPFAWIARIRSCALIVQYRSFFIIPRVKGNLSATIASRFKQCQTTANPAVHGSSRILD